MKIQLDRDLKHLKQETIKMADHVKESLKEVIVAFKESDKERAKNIIAKDIHINNFQIRLDKLCLRIFALKQPKAFDLRFVLAILKVNAFLERIGDFAATIAGEVIKIQKEAQLIENYDEVQYKKWFELFQWLFHIGIEMYELSFHSFIDGNAHLARKVIAKDAKMNELYKKSVEKIILLARQDPKLIKISLSLNNIAKSLERIGDYATNISEQTIYTEEGQIIEN